MRTTPIASGQRACCSASASRPPRRRGGRPGGGRGDRGARPTGRRRGALVPVALDARTWRGGGCRRGAANRRDRRDGPRRPLVRTTEPAEGTAQATITSRHKSRRRRRTTRLRRRRHVPRYHPVGGGDARGSRVSADAGGRGRGLSHHPPIGRQRSAMTAIRFVTRSRSRAHNTM